MQRWGIIRLIVNYPVPHIRIKGGRMKNSHVSSPEKSDHQAVNIAMTIWGNRVSPVFDSASTLMIARVEGSKITRRKIKSFDPSVSSQITAILNEYEVDALICGAITEIYSKPIEQSGVKLISFISGNADKVLGSYIDTPGRILDYLMPGAISQA